jgi:hypothetical protein
MNLALVMVAGRAFGRPRAAHRRYLHAGRLGAAQIKYGLCGN